ncbi:hypothetical protein I2488_11260 [Novosphingobium sp. 1Y9A]|uniref:IstB-like ATP-binding domain-containing protein n=1 Tax=Novosphingobium jiangmenense TaxID=2791981 RepID=A0ABS0HH44_9SPHN|nr:hypothetical protein [Novosphingobium jiangmenense]
MNTPRMRLDIDATREKLCQLACGHAADTLDDMIGEAVRDEISAHVFLVRLLTTELAGREERRVRVMLKNSKLPSGQTLENFDFAFQLVIERSRIDTLATGT